MSYNRILGSSVRHLFGLPVRFRDDLSHPIPAGKNSSPSRGRAFLRLPPLLDTSKGEERTLAPTLSSGFPKGGKHEHGSGWGHPRFGTRQTRLALLVSPIGE